jgi:hypothetical protein
MKRNLYMNLDTLCNIPEPAPKVHLPARTIEPFSDSHSTLEKVSNKKV